MAFCCLATSCRTANGIHLGACFFLQCRYTYTRGQSCHVHPLQREHIIMISCQFAADMAVPGDSASWFSSSCYSRRLFCSHRKFLDLDSAQQSREPSPYLLSLPRPGTHPLPLTAQNHNSSEQQNKLCRPQEQTQRHPPLKDLSPLGALLEVTQWAGDHTH